MSEHLGFSGRIARAFQGNPLTPVLALAGLLLGLAAVLVTPREEEPQIDVTMANVTVPFPGASVEDVENLVSYPLEQVLAEIEGVRHVYSASRPGVAALTVEFQVGVPRQTAIVRLYNQVYANADWAPSGLGVGQPLVQPMGIDDVPVMALTLWTEDGARGATELAEVAHTLESELKRVPGTRDVYTIGAPDRAVLVQLDTARLAAYGLTTEDLVGALRAANVVTQAGERIGAEGVVPVTAGTFLADADEVAELVIGLHQGKPVYLSDVAQVTRGADLPTQYVWHGAPAKHAGPAGIAPAVTLAIAKQPGRNAADITRTITQRMQALRGSLIPQGVQYTITRDYGQTATDKAMKLIHKLIFATVAVVLLVLLALGWREAVIVGTAVVVTLALTLFASWAMGFTLNRVSLFALIFAIGILVDDAIVVVENIHRWQGLYPDKSLLEIIPPAVDEVGGPTILATLTVIAALLPMAFVTGLMGPYMSPIPINSSMGMAISLAVAFVVTPWLAARMMKSHGHAHGDGAGEPQPSKLDAKLDSTFRKLLTPFLDPVKGGAMRVRLAIAIVLLILGSVSLAYFQLVVLKMLPFDNKSEFQVILDMPVGTPVEETARVLHEIGAELALEKDVTNYQAYAGTASPINFNGLVRQYYLRALPEKGDIQVNLADKHHRSRQSHEIASALRDRIEAIGKANGGVAKVVEVPPGPPVMSPILAEIYGPDMKGQMSVGKQVRQVFEETKDIVAVDDYIEADSRKVILHVLQSKAAQLGVAQSDIVEVVSMGLAGQDVTPAHNTESKFEIPVRVTLPAEKQSSLDALLKLRVRSRDGQLVPVSELVEVRDAAREKAIYHKDLLPVVYVVGDMGGKLDSPLYGMFDIRSKINGMELKEGGTLGEWFIRQPNDPYAGYSVKWDGEWKVTYETFRDMGIAYGVGLILIYLLVVAHFGSYLVPLIIMAPIPLTIIGVMPGHALFGSQFTATSMIGMIALAGIIVRNSILLVDFIKLQVATGMPFREAVIQSAAVRAKPIALTALAAMLGAMFILDDPIFNGLALALIFGIMVSTLLTLVVIPVLYFSAFRKEHQA